jgi:negative regulator of sigma E activity
MDIELRDELISAALDGERVDVEALRGALATDEGRKSLAAFVLLRAATAADDIAPRVRYEDPVTVLKPRRAWLTAGTRVPAALAASIAIVAVVTSFLLGTTLRAPNTTLIVTVPPIGTAPMAPLTVAVPVPAGERHVEQGFSPATTFRPRLAADQPPKPTRVLRFVPGVDWRSAFE